MSIFSLKFGLLKKTAAYLRFILGQRLIQRAKGMGLGA
jgi:hypothetical protein